MHSEETDKVNDIVKLIMHRLVARAVGEDVRLISTAKEALSVMERRLGRADYMGEWESLLELEPQELRRLLTERTETMDRLRKSSPFLAIFGAPVDFRDPDLRTRLWRIAKRIYTLRAGRDALRSPNRSAA